MGGAVYISIVRSGATLAAAPADAGQRRSTGLLNTIFGRIGSLVDTSVSYC